MAASCRRRPAIRCRPTACAGSTSSACSSSATATSRRRRAVSTCTGAPCSASSASTPPANTDARALITLHLVVNALALGMAYALVALGFVLALNASGAVNFAHGDLVVLGGAVAVLAGSWFGLPAPVLLPIVALALGLAGIVAARVAILPLADRPPEATFVATIALAAIIEHGLTLAMGGAPRTAPALAGSGVFEVMGLAIGRQPLAIILVGGIVVGGVWLLLERTQMGRRR